MEEVKANVKEDFRLARKVIANSDPTILSTNEFDIYKPYWATTENLTYMNDLTKDKKLKSAFTILSGGDTVFELMSLSAEKIITTDTNPFSKYIYFLKKAAIKTLSIKEYMEYIFDPKSMNFLSKKIFDDKVVKGFTKDEEDYKEFWIKIFTYYNKKDLLKYFFRPIFRYTKAEDRKTTISYIHNKKYESLRNQINDTDIKIYSLDAKNVLEAIDEEFDFIHFSNILLYIVQQYDIASNDFDSYVKDLKQIIEKRLRDNGIFVIDYMFKSYNPKQYLKDNQSLTGFMATINEIYSIIYRTVNEYFEVQAIQYKSIPSTMNSIEDNKIPDQVIYTKKKNSYL